MKLRDEKYVLKSIALPNVLQNKMFLRANCDLTDEELKTFQLTLNLVAKYIAENNIDISRCDKFNILFTSDGSFSFFEEDPRVCGMQLQLAIYRMERIRKLQSITMTLFVYIEELAHYLLGIYDETIIKHRVADIIKYVVPDFDLQDLKELGLNGL